MVYIHERHTAYMDMSSQKRTHIILQRDQRVDIVDNAKEIKTKLIMKQKRKETVMQQTPILFLGDNPAMQGGLSRIGRDIATVVSRMPEFRVGFLGRGGLPTTRLEFMQYTYPEFGGWGEEWLQDAWTDFARGEEGIVFTIWDPSRLLWLGDPVGMPNEEWLRKPPFKKWGYFPIDHCSYGGKLSTLEAAAVAGYDRVLAYGEFGAKVIENSVKLDKPCSWIPHGINMSTFQPRDATGVRLGHGIGADQIVIGVVMTNQTRKDWGLTFEIIAKLKEVLGSRLYVWCKTDSIDRHWDFRALTADFGVGDVVHVDLEYLTDVEMSYMYSTCNLVLLPSLGEGFGYPIVESMACGTPCVTGSYAGEAELSMFRVSAYEFRYESTYNSVRPVYSSDEWVQKILEVLGNNPNPEDMRAQVVHLNWPNLHTVWERWFREGLQ